MGLLIVRGDLIPIFQYTVAGEPGKGALLGFDREEWKPLPPPPLLKEALLCLEGDDC